MTKSEAARANGRKGGRPRKNREQPPQSAQDAPFFAPVPDAVPVAEPITAAPEASATPVPPLDNPFNLAPRELLFVEAYCGVAKFNASEAYRIAGFDSKPESVGPNAGRLIKKDQVADAIRARLALKVYQISIMDGDEALSRISTFARADIRKLFPPGSPIANLPDEVAACIKSVTPNKFGTRIELIDPLRASELMAKVAGRLKETIKVEHTLEEIMALANRAPEPEHAGTAA